MANYWRDGRLAMAINSTSKSEPLRQYPGKGEDIWIRPFLFFTVLGSNPPFESKAHLLALEL
jgi:hypothetical protein